MKLPKLTFTALGLLLLAGSSFAGPLLTKTPPAQPIVPPAPTSGGWYWGVSSGYLWLNDSTLCGCEKLNYSDGWGINGAVGYRFSNAFTLGLGAGYLNGQYDVTDGGSADLHMVPITLNATYNINLTNSLLIYLGAGIGTAWSELEGVDDVDSGGDWHLVWQARAGFGYKVNNDVTVNLGYRYIDVTDGVGGFDDAKGHMAEAGLKVNF